MIEGTQMQFIDLQAQRRRLQRQIDAAISRVLDHGGFIMGREVPELEAELSQYCGVQHTISCSNGTEALVLALRALGLGAGDAVFVPSFTFAATAEAVVLAGAIPVFVDCLQNTYNMDSVSLKDAVGRAAELGLRPRGLIPVDLFGQPADYDALEKVAADAGLTIIADAAQSFGATWSGRRTGSIGTLATTSFFPAKPLGCYGDGGAVFTDDGDLASLLRSLRVHGQGRHKYENVRVGTNARLDTIQAAVLLQKLTIFDDELRARDAIASRYSAKLADVVTVPILAPASTSAWAQYTIVVEDRDNIAARLKRDGIPTAIYYPVPLHRQPAYAGFPCAPSGLPVSDRLADAVLSLPMHPYLDEDSQDQIVEAVRTAITQ